MVVWGVRIGGAVLASIEVATVVNWVIWASESIAWIIIYNTTVSVIGVIDICDSIVVIIPVNVVFKAVPVNI